MSVKTESCEGYHHKSRQRVDVNLVAVPQGMVLLTVDQGVGQEVDLLHASQAQDEVAIPSREHQQRVRGTKYLCLWEVEQLVQDLAVREEG